jgi:putative hemolysin
MDFIPLEFLFILLLIFSNGFLAMSEIAIVSARKVRLQQRAEAGDAASQAALELAEEPGRFLSTVQIGITLVGILAGAFGGATLADRLTPIVAQVEVLRPFSRAISMGLIVLLITYLSLVLGELAPKQIALNNSERIAAMIAPLMQFLSRLTAPVVTLLTLSTNFVLRLMGVRPSTEPSITEEEIGILMGQGADSGIFEPMEEKMVRQVFRLGDRRLDSLTTPRHEIIWLDLEDPPDVTQSKILDSRHNHFPVAEGGLDNLLGFVRSNDLLTQCLNGERLDIRAALRPPVFVPENLLAFDVLERFRETRSQIAFSIDEYGGIQGLVTLHDILEAIVGDIPEPDEDDDPDAVQREDGSWLIDGLLPIEEFKDLFNLKELPGESGNYFQTVGGFVMSQMGRIPLSGDSFQWEDLRIEVVDMDGHRVDKIMISSEVQFDEHLDGDRTSPHS